MTDRADFEEILIQTHAQIRAYIAGLGASSHDVDDLAQEVYLALFQNLDRIPHDVAPIRWLKGIAKKICLNHFQRTTDRRALHRKAIAELLARRAQKTMAAENVSDVQDALIKCIEQLPSKSRKMVELRYRHDFTAQNIADTLNQSAEAIRVALHRIRKVLEKCVLAAVGQV